MAIGGLDIGTTGCKLTVYRQDGALMSHCYREYEASRVAGEHEIDARMVWNAVREVMAETAVRVPSLSAVGVTSFGEAFVLLDEADDVLTPSMLYTDPRGAAECERLVDAVGKERIIAAAGMMPHGMYSLPKLMWVRENRPEIYEKTKRVLLYQDYIVYMLTGTAQIDWSLATRTMAFDIRQKCWCADLLSAAGVDAALLSAPVPSGTPAGPLRAALARELGFTGRMTVVSCCHDQAAAAVGAGVFTSGQAVDGTGTVECVTPVLDGPPTNPCFYEGGYAVVPHALPGKYLCYAFSFTGGALLKWFRDGFARAEAAEAAESGKNVYALLDSRVPEKPTGILILPHFAGAATPYMDTGSKGAVIGLTLEHNARDLYKALMEGVTYEMLLNLERLGDIRVDALTASGGGAASPVWLQIKADILNRPIRSLGSAEAGTAGSVMLAGTASGLYRDLDEAARALVREGKEYQPRAEQHDIYARLFERYRRLYDAVRPLM